MHDSSKTAGWETLLPPPIQQHYRVGAVAQRLGISEKTIIRRLKDDPDVLVMTDPKRGTRKYKTYLIPEGSIQRLLGGFRPRG
jgi:hypothetical protein